jgi:probable rRNA maturation factor
VKRLPSITVRNAQRKRRVAVDELQRFAERACALCRDTELDGNDELEHLNEVTIVLVSDRRMAVLHKRFMNIDGPTDVLTFHHGEIFISVETAEQNAAQFATTPEDEIRLYIVHGLLHLRGFEDVDATNARRMKSVQQQILATASAE